jgi:hypothetical protein
MSNGTSTPPAAPPSVQNPLTLLLPIRNAEVYALRSNLPAMQANLKIALDSIGIVHFARLVFLPNTNILAVITEFDGDFNDYILAFVRNIGVAAVFNQILALVDDVDTPPSVPPASDLVPVSQNADGFVQLLDYYNCTSASRADSFAWYSASPSLTVKQILANAKPGT